MRRVLNQAANAAPGTKGSIFQALYRRWLPRLGHQKTIWAIAHRLCRLVWIILHRGDDYIEYGEHRDSSGRMWLFTLLAAGPAAWPRRSRAGLRGIYVNTNDDSEIATATPMASVPRPCPW
ncbi:MAG: hypothetical protein ACLQU1_12100 [Bryobacteraceae bacterium]